MQIWQVIVVPLLTALLVAITRPIEIAALRRRMGSVNSIRTIAEFMILAQEKLGDGHPLRAEIQGWLERPNVLGSEASLGVLLAKICVATRPTEVETRRIDRALNALDQRASERERTRSVDGATH